MRRRTACNRCSAGPLDFAVLLLLRLPERGEQNEAAAAGGVVGDAPGLPAKVEPELAELPEEFALRESPDKLTLSIDGSLTFPAGNPHVCHLTLAGTVHDTAHHSDFDRRRVLFGYRLDHASELASKDALAADEFDAMFRADRRSVKTLWPEWPTMHCAG